MKKITLLLLCFLAGNLLLQAQKNRFPVPVIFDTDMGPDYDDVGAIAMLHAFADAGKTEILATIASTRYVNVVPVLSVLNTYFKRPEIPIGFPSGWAQDLRDWQHWSDMLVAKYPHSLKNNSDAEDAVKLYRKILATQPDGHTVIITVGFLTNLEQLLRSEGDDSSPLTGVELVRKKVKRLVSMAGKFPSGKEFNVDRHIEASDYVFRHWPTQVYLSGFEIGQKIKTGLPLVRNRKIQNSPVKDVFRISIPMAAEDNLGRMSWDQTAVMAGVLGHESFYTLQQGRIIIDTTDGSNTWEDDPRGQHFYFVEKMKPARVEKKINTWMMHQPK